MIDYEKPTRRYEMPPNPEMKPGKPSDIDWTASTGLYPMAPDPVGLNVVDQLTDADGKTVDFARSANRYPMYGEPAKAKRGK